MISRYMKRHIQRRDAKIRELAKTMPVPEIAKRIQLTPARVYQILGGTGGTAPKRSSKGGQNKPLKQAKYEQSGPKGSKVDPDR